MSDFLNKMVMLIIIFVMLIIGPFTLNLVSNDASSKRLITNEVEKFLDEVKNKGAVNSSDLDELYSSVNSHGIGINVEVKKYKRALEKDSLNDTLLERYIECDKSTAYDEMMWDTNSESSYMDYKIRYNITDTDADKVIKKLKSIRSNKYDYCLESGDIVKVELNEVGVSATRRLVFKVLGVSECAYHLELETMLK